MKRIACLLALLALTGCESELTPSRFMTLICKQDGRETYRATQEYWYFSDGVWRFGYGGPQYKPSLLESCHTEVGRR